LSRAKILYYFADHWLGYLLKTYPAKVRNDLVIFDRSFEDVFIDPERYRLSGGGRLARWLNRLLPRADLTIVLDADPEIVHARKPELPIEELRRQRAILQRLTSQSDRCTLVAATAPTQQVARAVQCHMITFLAKREAHRHPA
jgi:thymidylate kinase